MGGEILDFLALVVTELRDHHRGGDPNLGVAYPDEDIQAAAEIALEGEVRGAAVVVDVLVHAATGRIVLALFGPANVVMA